MEILKSRKDIMKDFNISFKAVVRIERELEMFDNSDKSHKKFDNEMYNRIKKHIELNYLLPENAVKTSYPNCYATKDGIIYRTTQNSGLYYKATYNINYGYAYCKVNNKNMRVHRIIAETFIPNPNNYPLVMHLNNEKLDNDAENLAWGTSSHNTKQAYDDGLAVNLKGYEDCQSMPVHMHSMDGRIIDSYGSISIASRKTNISKSTIARQCKHKSNPRNGKFYFRYQ